VALSPHGECARTAVEEDGVRWLCVIVALMLGAAADARTVRPGLTGNSVPAACFDDDGACPDLGDRRPISYRIRDPSG
jgi:hypothetical protein